jgi:hypothetical protein
VVAGIHPDRVVAGRDPSRGLVLAGTVLSARPAGAGWESDIQLAGGAVTCRLPERPGPDGSEIVLTALDPPLFGPDGSALPVGSPGPDTGTRGGRDPGEDDRGAGRVGEGRRL